MSLFSHCYESLCLIKLRIDSQSKLLLQHQGDGWWPLHLSEKFRDFQCRMQRFFLTTGGGGGITYTLPVFQANISHFMATLNPHVMMVTAQKLMTVSNQHQSQWHHRSNTASDSTAKVASRSCNMITGFMVPFEVFYSLHSPSSC